MTDINRIGDSSKLNPSMRKLWKISLWMYLICNTAFASQSYLMMLNSYAMYFFLVLSMLCILSAGELKFNAYTISVVAFMMIILGGNLYSTSSYAISYTYDFFVSFCIVFCIMNYIENELDIEFIFKTLMVGGIVLDFYVLSIYGAGFIDAIMEQNRVGEVAGNVNDVGLKSCYAALIALFFLLNHKNKIHKLLYISVCVIGAFFSIITASKKVLILLLLGCVYMFVFTGIKKKNFLVILRNLGIAIVASALILVLIYNLKYFEYMRVRIDELFDMLLNGGGNSSDQKRMRFLVEGLAVFAQNPIFGDGTAASFNYFNTYSHSNFVEILMNHGLVGFVAYYFAYPIAIYRCFKKKKENTERTNLSALCLFFYISILILSIALVYYTFIYYHILLSVSAAYVLNRNMNAKRES